MNCQNPIRKKIILIFSVFLFFLIAPNNTLAAVSEFNIDSSYDYIGRSKISAFLYQIGSNAFFYVEDGFYQNLDTEKKQAFADAVRNLSQEFDGVIYPKLTETYGSEQKPGIDKDEKITVLITRIKEDAAGYFNEGDEYPKNQVPTSNEREMIYISASYITSPLAKIFLAHEFTHLITFNQKTVKYGQTEETWLNEGRAEAASTILGYDTDYANSNLLKRISDFSQKPKDPLTEWKDLSTDYGVVDMFIQYLLDHYGKKILADSLQSGKLGIPSLNYALSKNGYSEDFSQIFTNWSIAILVNNCNLGQKYCYLNQNLKNIRVVPQINYLPPAGEITLSASDFTKNWAGNWLKFIGGEGTLKFEFIGDQNVKFRVPYLLLDSSGNYSVNFLNLNDRQTGIIYISDFGKKYISFTIIPTIQSKIIGFDGIESSYKFIWSASTINSSGNPPEEENKELIAKLSAQIALLENQIAQIQAQINAILGKKISCTIVSDLYFGMQNNSEVSCLQEFLKSQGSEVYPEGLVTGNFLSLTQMAVIRFQEKYVSEILSPLGFEKGTGFVGPMTRSKINQLLILR